MKTRFNKKAVVIGIGVIVIIIILGLGGINMMREINEEKSVSMDQINTIQVDMTTVGVHIIRTETSNEVKVNFHGKAMQEIKLVSETNNKTLFVTVQRKHEKFPLYEDAVLDVYIPKGYTKNLSLKMLSGDVKIDSFKLENFTLDTSSGKLEAEQLKADKISINSTSGNLKIKKIDTKILDVKGKSSAINIDECIANETGIETSTGKVLVSYKAFEDQNINITTSTGSVTLELPETAEFLVEAKTSSGKFQSDFPIKTTDKKDIKGQVGTKNNKLLLKTSSGSINILKKY